MELERFRVYNLLCRRKLVWYNPRTWIHFLIRIITKSPIDQVGFIFFDGIQWMQAESTTGKVKVIPLKNWLEKSKFHAWIQKDDYATFKRKHMISYAFECEDLVKYDFLGLIWMWIYLKRKVWLGPQSNQNKRQFCSEFYFNCKGVKNSQYKTPKDALISGQEVLGCVVGYYFGNPLIESRIKIPQ